MDARKFTQLLKLGREYGHAKIRDAGFSDSEHAICAFLSFHDGVSQDAIAAALMLDKTTVAKALRSLEEKGRVHRTPNERNRRQNVIRITEAGRQGVAGSRRLYETWWDAVGACLSEEESSRLDAALDRMIERALALREDAAKEA
jgi:DNA-binding MarR family transcriptional regulator